MRQNRIQKAVGRSIRKRREAAGLSQEALAAISDLHRTYIGSVERGERNLTLLNFFGICEALNCKASQILKDAENDELE